MNPVVTFHDRETEAKLAGFFQEWDRKYQEAKKTYDASIWND